MALAVSAGYSAVTYPQAAGLWFAAVECLVVGVTGVLLWNSCFAAIRYHITAAEKYGFWYFTALLLVCTGAALAIAMTDAALSGCFGAYCDTLAVKSFCLLTLYTATALGSILYADYHSDAEETAAPLPEALPVEEPRRVETVQSITVKNGNDIDIIDVTEVMFLKAEGDYVSIVTERGSYLKEQTMKYFAQALPQDRFIRIHRSYIINSRYLQSIERYGEYQMVLMSCGEKIRISATGYKLLKERLGI